MALCGLVKGRGDDLGIDARGHVGDFLGTLVDEQDDHVDLGVIGGDGVGDILQQHRLTRLGLRYDEAALSLTDGGEEVDDTHSRLVLDCGAIACSEVELLLWEDGRQVVKGYAVTHLGGCTAVDTGDLVEGEVLVPLLRRTDEALDEVTWTEAPLLDLGGREVDIVG